MRAFVFACFTFMSFGAPWANAAEPFSPSAAFPQAAAQGIQIALSREQRITRQREKRASAERRRADAASSTDKYRNRLEELSQEITLLTGRKKLAERESRAVAKELRKTRDMRVQELTLAYREALNVIRDKYIGKPGPMGREARNRKKLFNMEVIKANQVVIDSMRGYEARISNLEHTLERKHQERATVQNELAAHVKKVKKIDKEISKIDRKLRKLGARNVTS